MKAGGPVGMAVLGVGACGGNKVGGCDIVAAVDGNALINVLCNLVGPVTIA